MQTYVPDHAATWADPIPPPWPPEAGLRRAGGGPPGVRAGPLPAQGRAPAARVAASIWALEHAQDFVTVAVGVVLIVLAATLAVSGVAGLR